ncbi:hypothetical protein GCM10027059_34450 [Myceligenerans halotolerans]
MTRVRPTWPDLPATIRAAIEERLGAKVTSWVSHDGGYSPGLASVLTTTRGSAFVKTASPDQAEARRLHRSEAAIAARLPDTVPAPTLLWSLDVSDDSPAPPQEDTGWAVLAFEPVDGRAVRTDPWDMDDVDLLARLALRIGEHPAPDGDEFPDFAATPWPHPELLADERPDGLSTYDPWLAANLDLIAQITAHDRQAEALAGNSLVHGDFRADNVLIAGPEDRGRGVVVDWPWAARGAAFRDLVAMLPAVHALGGPAPSAVLDRTPLPPGTDPEAVLTWVAIIAAYFVHSSLQPPPRGIPHLRRFQRVQAESGIAWLRELIGAR